MHFVSCSCLIFLFRDVSQPTTMRPFLCYVFPIWSVSRHVVQYFPHISAHASWCSILTLVLSEKQSEIRHALENSLNWRVDVLCIWQCTFLFCKSRDSPWSSSRHVSSSSRLCTVASKWRVSAFHTIIPSCTTLLHSLTVCFLLFLIFFSKTESSQTPTCLMTICFEVC